MEIILLVTLLLCLWLSSIYMLSGWKKFKYFFVTNLILITIYWSVLIYGTSIWGHDEYGLGFMYRLSICILIHVISVFIFALIKRKQLKN